MNADLLTALVVDSGACLPALPGPGAPVTVVPMAIEIDGRSLRDGVDITSAEFYALLDQPGPLPTSSSPSPGDYLTAFREAPAADILCLAIPARFSTMIRSANLAAEMLREEQPKRRVEVMDTGTAAGGFTLVADAAATACAAGLPLARVAAYTREVAQSAQVIAALDTMRFLVRSGRVPALAGLGSDLLHVRPVFSFSAGDVQRLALVRGTKRALRVVAQSLRDRVAKDISVRLAIFCGGAPAAVPALVDSLKELFGERPIERLDLTPVMALHTGPGLIGAAAVADLPLPTAS